MIALVSLLVDCHVTRNFRAVTLGQISGRILGWWQNTCAACRLPLWLGQSYWWRAASKVASCLVSHMFAALWLPKQLPSWYSRIWFLFAGIERQELLRGSPYPSPSLKVALTAGLGRSGPYRGPLWTCPVSILEWDGVRLMPEEKN